MDDEALVRRFKATRDPAWFAELFSRHRRQIYYSCRRVLDDSSAAEDITHDTFVRAFMRIDQYEEDCFLNWLKVIARHFCLNHLMSAIVRSELTGLDEKINEEPPGVQDFLNTSADVADVMRQLPVQQRLCLKLFYWEGYSYREIASITRYSDDQVRSNIQNGKRRFQIFWTEGAR